MTNSSKNASLNSVIDDAVESRLKELHTCTPGIIESFDPETKRAEIQPAINRILMSGEIKTLPKLINCPLGLIQFGGFAITGPVAPGDECMIHFTERSLDSWIKFGDVRQPNDLRIHHESDAYFVPVHTSDNNPLVDYDANNFVLRNGDNTLKIVFDTSGGFQVTAATQITMTAPTTRIEGNLEVTGDSDITGTSTAAEHQSGVITLTGHKHPTAAVGPPSAPIP